MARPEPGRDPEMARRTAKLNVVFAVSSLLMLLVFSWMVFADYSREWRRYQIEFNRLEIKATQDQIQEALGKVGADRLKALEAELTRGTQAAAARTDEIRAVQDELAQIEGQWYAVDQDWRFTKARIDVARYEYDEAVHKGRGNAASLKKEWDDLEADWARSRKEKEAVEARRADARARLAELQKVKLAAEEKEKELLGEKQRLDERLRKLEPGFVSVVRNLPILDMANPSQKVNQIMPANLYDDVVFSPTPKVDRCTTCHQGIDQAAYEKAPQPHATHPDLELYLHGPHPVERVGCTVCHQGRGRATSFQKAAHVPSTKEQEKAWGKYTKSAEYHGLHYWDLPMMAKGHTESQCRKCHQDVVEVPKADRLNTGLLLVERYGCFGCHKIKGWEGLRKVGPDLSKVASKTSAEWIARWIEEPRAFRPTRMPQVWGVRTEDKQTPDLKARDAAEMAAVAAFIVHKSSRSEYPAPPKGDLERGRALFEQVGCLACHRVGDDGRGLEEFAASSFRTHGPNLDGTGSKVEAGWLYAWIRDPKGYWHQTRMPRLRLTPAEAADVTAYLMSLRNEEFMARPAPTADAAVQDAIVREYLEAQLTVDEAGKRLAAMSHEERTLLLGEKTVARYGCFGCHDIPGFENANPIGTELTEQGSKLVERLDFGFEHDRLPHTLPAWLHEKLVEPRIFDRAKARKHEELLRMPKFHFAPDEADAVVTGILSLTKEQVPLVAQKRLSADERHVEEGARLVRDLNCRGCHQIGEKGGTIRAVIQDMEEKRLEKEGKDTLDARINAPALAPPLLYNAASRIGEGARVHTPWLHEFLKDPSRQIRPWLEIRMPTFDLTEEQTNTLTRYFASMDGVPYPYEPRPEIDPVVLAAGRDLFGKWQCVRCHVVAGKLPEGQEVANMAPDLARVPERLRAAWLTRWLADPQRILPGTRMPANFPEDPQMNAYPEILGGDQGKQIEAVRAYLLTLGGPRGGAAAAQ